MDLEVKNPKTLGKKIENVWACRRFMMPKSLKKLGISGSFLEIQHRSLISEPDATVARKIPSEDMRKKSCEEADSKAAHPLQSDTR